MSRVPKSIFSRMADVAHKTVGIGLISFFGFHVYQLVSQVRSGKLDHPTLHSTYKEELNAKIREDYQGKGTRIWYDKDEIDFEKDQLRANYTKPEFLQEFKEKQKQQTK